MRRMMAADEKQAWSSEKAHFPSQSASSASEPYPAYPTSPESFTSLASAESYGGEQDGSALDQKRVEKSLVRKLDWCVLPVLVVMCAFTVVDKAGVRYVEEAQNKSVYDIPVMLHKTMLRKIGSDYQADTDVTRANIW